jgi:hypothetical protein
MLFVFSPMSSRRSRVSRLLAMAGEGSPINNAMHDVIEEESVSA